MHKIRIFLTAAIFILSMFVVQAQTPGGVSNASYTWQVWLTPDSYDDATGVWTNRITGTGTVGNFTAPATKPNKVNTGYNSHPSVEFTKSGNTNASKRLTTAGNGSITAGQNITSIFVYKRAGAKYNNDCMFSFSTSHYHYSLGFYSGNSSNDLNLYWPNTNSGKKILTAREGIIAVDNANNAASSQVISYLNGNSSTATVNQGSISAPWKIGSDGAGEYGFEGTIQEIIILKASDAGNHIAPIDLQKIHSYLALKYGISLENGRDDGANYVNSNGYAVWNRESNPGYNHNFIGIGRDNATLLNQVQSRSSESSGGADMLTVYKGTLNPLNDNNSNELDDGDFLILGSNGAIGDSVYNHPAGTTFAGGISITERLNYRSAAVYKAQVTTAGAAGAGQTVNIGVVSSTTKYILVSTDPKFANLANTRIYPITNMNAENVVIYNGEYVTTAGYQVTPGGSTSVTLAMWLTGDSYSNGVWTNLIGGAIGDFTQPANWSKKTPPVKSTSGQNFHPAVQFRTSAYNAALNRLQSEKGINLTDNDAFTFILVYKATNAGYQYQNILNFAGGNEYDLSNYALGYLEYRNNNADKLYMGWPINNRRMLGSAPYGKTALVTVDNSNQANANGIRHYQNGLQIATVASENGKVNNPIILGGSYRALESTSARGINADIQEIIMLQRPKNISPFLADVNSGNDLKKIQTYLALKYGLTVAHNYMATNDAVVWDTTVNTGYNKNIIGIGRDDNTGLYQKQSVSAVDDQVTIFLGDKLETLNSQNKGTLDDMQYLVLGSNGLKTIIPSHIFNDSLYANGQLHAEPELNFKSGAIYKAQLTNVDSIGVNLQTTIGYSYAFVSKTPDFVGSETRFYAVEEVRGKYIATVPVTKEYKYIRFAGYNAGPGGIHDGLILWLNAGDRSSVITEDFTDISGNIANYSPYGSISMPINNVYPAVQTWSDPIRSINYSFVSSTNGGLSQGSRMPMLSPYNREMNYHPSVHFWGDENRYGAYLKNTVGLFNTAFPDKYEFSAIFVVNNDKANNSDRRSYYMGFGNNGSNISGYYPAFGVIRNQANSNITTPIFNVDGDPRIESGVPYSTGATAIMGYRTSTTNNAANGGRIMFSVDGVSDEKNVNFGTMAMNTNSVIGIGYQNARQLKGLIAEAIIFDRKLPDDDMDMINSYLAIKYGITLKESATVNYDYKFSDSIVFWPGKSDWRFQPYHHNVTAVIRDSHARLNNSQSHSTGAGSLLHMGVAGKYLASNGGNGEVDALENDREVIVWGSDSITSLRSVPVANTCGNFEQLFGKKWLVYKKTKDDRPLSMLVGAQNNLNNNLGKDAPQAIKDMYAILTTGYDLYMLVADSPAKLDPDSAAFGGFKAIVPMAYVNMEHQCNYTFTDSITYITFGYRANSKGCADTIQFENKKTFDWKQWTRKNYKIDGAAAKMLSKDTVDLGNGIQAVSKIAYDGSIHANANYPRVASSPRGGIEIQRRRGSTGSSSKVTAIIDFNTPVIPDFSISGLDAWYKQYDEVTVTGYCCGNMVLPVLSNAGLPKNASYRISGNTATVNKYRLLSATNKDGMVNVEFKGGVDSIVIEYTLQNRVYSSAAQKIFISPVNLRPVPPPMPLNEDGISFTKQAMEHNVTTCEDVEYAFYVENANCEDKYVHFNDILPAGMTWKGNSVGLDTINGLHNNNIKFNNYGNTSTLDIDSLLVPGVSTVKLTAAAQLGEDTPTDTYNNRASIVYEGIVNSDPAFLTLKSVDRETHDSLTSVVVTQTERKDTLRLQITSMPVKYVEDSVIQVTLKVVNPNQEDITGMFLDLTWDTGFAYVPGSWSKGAGSVDSTYVDDPTLLWIIGDTGEDSNPAEDNPGFFLPGGETVFTFKLRTPAKEELSYELDEQGNPTMQKAALNISYDFYSGVDEPCTARSISGLSGVLQVPYGTNSHVIVNKFITVEIE